MITKNTLLEYFRLNQQTIDFINIHCGGHYGKEFQRNSNLVRVRDEGKCRACGNDSVDNVVHHLNFLKFDNRIDNLILFCQSCHFKIHADVVNERVTYITNIGKRAKEVGQNDG